MQFVNFQKRIGSIRFLGLCSLSWACAIFARIIFVIYPYDLILWLNYGIDTFVLAIWIYLWVLRCHDASISPGKAGIFGPLLLVIFTPLYTPVVLITFSLMKGSNEVNQYGPVTLLQPGDIIITIIEVLLLISTFMIIYHLL
jgi:hypothetical protein